MNLAHPEISLAIVIAGFLTLFDLDDTFYVPKTASGLSWMGLRPKIWLLCWWWGFVIANGLLAGALYVLFLKDQMKDMNPWGAAAVAGFGYLALVRLKITTIQDVPIGAELFYEKAKRYAYKRINDITSSARRVELMTMVSQKSLQQLTTDVQLALHTDALLSESDRREIKKWMLGVLKTDEWDEDLKKLALANFILAKTRQNTD
jgi:hypothetical protein